MPHAHAGTVIGGVMLARSPYMPSLISFASVGTSALRSSNRSLGVPQSRPITTTRGPCCMSDSLDVLRRSGAGVLAPKAAPRFAYPTSRLRAALCPSVFDMTVLRRALQAFAAIWAGCGIALIVVPSWLLTNVFNQPRYPDYTYVRIAGAASVTLAALAVMVSRRDDAWWWAWAFAIATGLTATITLLHL